jgi:hypothetical protein
MFFAFKLLNFSAFVSVFRRPRGRFLNYFIALMTCVTRKQTEDIETAEQREDGRGNGKTGKGKRVSADLKD